MIRRLADLWWGVGAIAIYPLTALAVSRLSGDAADSVRFSPSFALAAALALALLPGRLAPQRARGWRGWLLAAAAWAVASHSLWLLWHFLRGDAGSLGRNIVALTLATQLLWGIGRSLGAGVGVAFGRLLRALPVIAAIPAFFLAWLAVAITDGNRRLFYAAALLACTALLAPTLPSTPIGPAPFPPYMPLALFLLAEAAAFYIFPARSGYLTASAVGYTVMTVAWTAAAQFLWLALLFALGSLASVPRLLALVNLALQLSLALGLPVAIGFLRGRLRFEDFLCRSEYMTHPQYRTEFFRGRMAGRRTAWIVQSIEMSDDSRILRQARALNEHGWRVVVCGYDATSPRPVEWSFIRLPTASPYRRRVFVLLAALSKFCLLMSAAGRPAPLRLAAARLHHWANPLWLHIRRGLLREARRHSELKADLVVAHNYFVCDVAHRLAQSFGAKLAVDCHEYAAGEYLYEETWRWKTRPYVVAVEDYYLRRADLVTTVCDGIAELLNREHILKRPAAVIRSVPFNNSQPFRAAGERIKILYHGDLRWERQLHVALQSMLLWRPEFDLILRGSGDFQYIAELRRLVAEKGLRERVFFEPPVPFGDIVSAANRADIGFLSYRNHSPNINFSLPNKFFEYMMAGLALCVGDLVEIGRLVRQYGVGRLIPEHTPEAIAAAINGFTREEIDRCKRASLRAAAELNWEREQERLLAAYEAVLGAVAAPPAAPVAAAMSAFAGE